jgi:hypothetical protein
MGESMVHAALNALKEGVKIRVTARVHSDCQSVDEEPDVTIDL